LHRKVFSRREAGWHIPSRARNEGFTGKAPAARQVENPAKCFCKIWRERMGEVRMKLCPVEREAQASWRGRGQPQKVCGGCEAGWLKSVFTVKTAPEKRRCVVK